MSQEKLNYKKPDWIVTAVEPLDDYILLVTFITGEKKHVDMNELIEAGGVFARLRDPEIFKLAHVDSPTVAWNGQIDIAPESLYVRGKNVAKRPFFNTQNNRGPMYHLAGI